MDIQEIIALLSRWAHILAVVTLVGGTLFMRFALVPGAGESGASAELRESIRKRWAKMVMISILFLLVSGFYNAVMKAMGFHLSMTYNLLLMTKIIVGFGIFYLASVIGGRSEKAQKFRERETHWLNILCALMLVMVLIAGYMKMSSAAFEVKVRDKVETSSVFDSSLTSPPVISRALAAK